MFDHEPLEAEVSAVRPCPSLIERRESDMNRAAPNKGEREMKPDYRYRPDQYRTVYIHIDKVVFWAVMLAGFVVLIWGY